MILPQSVCFEVMWSHVVAFYRKSAVIGVQPLHTSWNKKQQVRMQQKLMKVYEKELKDEVKKQKEVSTQTVLN